MPLLPARFTVASIWPLVPGAIVQGKGGNFAVVQPQEGRTLKIVTGIGVMELVMTLGIADNWKRDETRAKT